MKKIEIKFYNFLYNINFIKKWFDKKYNAISSINPDNFTVVDVKRFYILFPLWLCKFLCNQAVREGAFEINYKGNYKLAEKQ